MRVHPVVPAVSIVQKSEPHRRSYCQQSARTASHLVPFHRPVKVKGCVTTITLKPHTLGPGPPSYPNFRLPLCFLSTVMLQVAQTTYAVRGELYLAAQERLKQGEAMQHFFRRVCCVCSHMSSQEDVGVLLARRLTLPTVWEQGSFVSQKKGICFHLLISR